ncbi:unnamed protein product [Peniophora sp. CBMAI 1063]|nr:unnamed protein product [Peniophora sp. CBMAI 1063]
MASVTRRHIPAVHFVNGQPGTSSSHVPSNSRPAADNAYAGDYRVPDNHGAPPPSSSSMPAAASNTRQGATNFTLAPALGPSAHQTKHHVAPGQPATQPTMGTLVLQLPRPFPPMQISPAGTDMHVTVHDVWAAARRFRHAAATRDDLETLPEADRRRVKETFFQRVKSNRTPEDGLRRGDFLCGAIITGFVPVADTSGKATIAFALGKAP